MTSRTYTLLAGLCFVFLQACATQTDDRGPVTPDIKVSETEEGQAHGRCLIDKAREYAPMEGSPLELGIIGAAACNHTRERLRTMLLRRGGAAYTAGFMSIVNQEEDAKMIAEFILEARRRRGVR